MNALQQFVRIVLHRRFWAVLLTAFLVNAFAENLPKKPVYEFRIQPVSEERNEEARKLRRWTGCGSDVYAVTDDGKEVATKAGNHCVMMGMRSDPELKIWNSASGTRRHRNNLSDPDWRQLLLYGHFGHDSSLLNLLITASGKAVFDDKESWCILKRRFTLADHHTNERQLRMNRHGNELASFPDRFQFSPDGKTISYHVKCGQPVFRNEVEAEGTVIEVTRTGKQVAYLFGVLGRVWVGPNAESAISENNFEQDPRNEQPFLTLWRLNSSPRRTDLLLPSGTHRVEFSSDGRLVFAHSYSPGLVRWWDVSTGQQLGEVLTHAAWTIVDRGRLLVTRSDGALNCWDTHSGKELGDWDFRERPIGTYTHGALHAQAHDRFLLVTLDPDSRPPPVRSPKFLKDSAEKVGEKFIGKPESSSRILVLDVPNRRELGDVPGWSGVVSENGEWLATIDEEGIVRVWRMPLARPWARSVGYALAVVLGAFLVIRLVRWVRANVFGHVLTRTQGLRGSQTAEAAT